MLLQQGKGVAEGGFGVVAGLAVRLAAALVVCVFGNIEDLCKQAAGADKVFQLLVVELRQAARHHVLRCFAAQQRGHGFLHGAVGLRGQHGLQRAGEEGNVVEERRVFIGMLAGRFGHHGVIPLQRIILGLAGKNAMYCLGNPNHTRTRSIRNRQWHAAASRQEGYLKTAEPKADR